MALSEMPPPAHRIRLAYLDGLRGLAALYVVGYHLYLDISRHIALPWLQWLDFGHAAVGVFIVLSGYSLMLPITRSDSGKLSGGMKEYLRRRARRILPPYYAALFLTLLLAFVLPALRRPSDTYWGDITLPLFSPGALLSHLFLVHNLSPAWVWKICGPFWSVATEWQIYFLFPLLLLPVWRRTGNLGVLLVGFALGWGLQLKVPTLFTAYPIYIGLFGAGMVAASLNFRPNGPSQAVAKVPWGILSLLLGIAALALLKTRTFMVRSDVATGLATMCLLIACTRAVLQSGDQARPLSVRLLETRISALLGRFSYSLYLTHFQVIALVHLALIAFGCTIRTQALLLPILALPLSLIVAYAFHRVFERPFMSSAAPRAGD